MERAAPGSDVTQDARRPGTERGKLAVLRLRGLPCSATEQDVRDFFSPREVVEVHICRRHGRSTGQAFVVLEHEVEAKEAFTSLNKKNIGQRYIEIFNASEQDVEAIKTLAAESKLQGFVVRLRGLPFTASAAEVAQFLEPVELPRGLESVNLTYNPGGRPTGEAYVELADEESHRLVLKKHKAMLGVRYVEVFSSTRTELTQAVQQSKLYRSQFSWKQAMFSTGGGPGAATAAGAAAYGGDGDGADDGEDIQMLSGAFAGMYIPPGQTAATHHIQQQQQQRRLLLQQQQQLASSGTGVGGAGMVESPGTGGDAQQRQQQRLLADMMAGAPYAAGQQLRPMLPQQQMFVHQAMMASMQPPLWRGAPGVMPCPPGQWDAQLIARWHQLPANSMDGLSSGQGRGAQQQQGAGAHVPHSGAAAAAAMAPPMSAAAAVMAAGGSFPGYEGTAAAAAAMRGLAAAALGNIRPEAWRA